MLTTPLPDFSQLVQVDLHVKSIRLVEKRPLMLVMQSMLEIWHHKENLSGPDCSPRSGPDKRAQALKDHWGRVLGPEMRCAVDAGLWTMGDGQQRQARNLQYPVNRFSLRKCITHAGLQTAQSKHALPPKLQVLQYRYKIRSLSVPLAEFTQNLHTSTCL